MDRNGFLAGMGLGAAIALAGMVLGGQGQAPPAKKQPRIEFFDRILAKEINIVNDNGQTLINITEATDLGSIRFFDARKQELVRISGILKGGGRISTFENNKAMVELGSTPQGGMVRVNGVTAPTATNVILAATEKTGMVTVAGPDGKIADSLPTSIAVGAAGQAGAPSGAEPGAQPGAPADPAKKPGP